MPALNPQSLIGAVSLRTLILNKMGIITMTRAARCKDCKFHAAFYTGKQKLTKCLLDTGRVKPIYVDKTIRLNDYVCSKWELS